MQAATFARSLAPGAAAPAAHEAARGAGHRAATASAPLLASSIRGVALKVERRGGAATLRRARHARSNAVECNLVQKVSAKELDSLLNADQRPLPLVIDFYATWCGPCVILAKQLEQLAVEYHGEVQFLKVDTDEEYELANQLEIRGLPTLVFVNKDKTKLAKRTEGVLPLPTIKQLIEELYA